MKREKKEKLIKQKWRRNAADRGDERQWRGGGGGGVPDVFFFRAQRGVLHESGASTQLGETRPTDPIAPRVFVASARANVTPLGSRQPAPQKDSWLLAFLPGCRPWRRFRSCERAWQTTHITIPAPKNDITRVGGLIGP